MSIPFLPGNSFPNVKQTDFRKAHTLGYVNGYSVRTKPVLKIGLEPLEVDAVPSIDELLNRATLTFDHEQNIKTPRFVPSHVAYDKVVLRFDAYFKQTVHESTEQYHLRKVRILYFLEDDSLAVIEPPVENSGIPQGCLIKRQQMPKNSTETYKAKDLNVGVNITFYGKTFRIVSCDKFTEKYMLETEGITLNPPEAMPVDLHQESRVRAQPRHNTKVNHDKLNSYLLNDRKVLRFYCIWDDRESMFGELREFVLHYHLVDDSIEVREVQKPNNGRDPFPILLRRQQLPKSVHHLSDLSEGPKYTWKDLRIGACIDVLGRPFLLRDCDDYTRRFYNENGVDKSLMNAIPIEAPYHRKVEQTLPPYNGYGSVEDSMGSCKYLVLKPPRKDFVKLIENEQKVLRFVAKMESRHKEDQNRRFVITYRLADDMVTINEPPQRNAGIIGGKFLERTRVLTPGSSLTDPAGPTYYDAKNFYVGGAIEVLSRKFILLDADEFAFNYMEQNSGKFTFSDTSKCQAKISSQLKNLSRSEKGALIDALMKSRAPGTNQVDRSQLISIAKPFLSDSIVEHELITFARHYEAEVRKPNVVKLIDSL